MNISVFDVVGPMMIGPSSSHTAGAARLARVAGLIAAAKPWQRVTFGLSGSFAKTYKGHGTDRALVAGALGLKEDDERLAEAFELAAQQGIEYEFYETELDGLHENSVLITFHHEGGGTTEVTGSSIGGGRIVVHAINGFETEFSANASTLVIRQNDQKGVLSQTTGILAAHGLNIGVMKLSRMARGGEACCVIEVDGEIPAAVVDTIQAVPGIYAVQALNIPAEEE